MLKPRVKTYDRAYYDRWYRDPRHAVIHAGVLERRVRLAVSAAEYLLERTLATVLDVGCGEAPWRAKLLHLRPEIDYQGVDSSEYVVERYGASRGIRLGSVGALGRLGLRGPFDLVVCSDVLHYVGTDEVRSGLRAMAKLTGGVAFVETFSKEDPIEGDRQELQRRTAAEYLDLFAEAGLVPVGLHCYVAAKMARRLVKLESPARVTPARSGRGARRGRGPA